jgi:phosphopantetheinyl transferase (holo-ACP synthase)
MLCEECEIEMEEECCIYLILSKLSSAYYVFLSTFYAMREAIGKAYQKPTLESFCATLIREEYKLVQLEVTNTTGTSNKSLVSYHKDKPKYPKKQHPCYNNKQHKSPKPAQTTSSPNGDKGEKYKNKKTNRHCNFCDKDGHDESNVLRRLQL